jgi:hypothetical protein
MRPPRGVLKPRLRGTALPRRPYSGPASDQLRYAAARGWATCARAVLPKDTQRRTRQPPAWAGDVLNREADTGAAGAMVDVPIAAYAGPAWAHGSGAGAERSRRELEAFLPNHDTFPTYTRFRTSGVAGSGKAMRRYGGPARVADDYGLAPQPRGLTGTKIRNRLRALLRASRGRYLSLTVTAAPRQCVVRADWVDRRACACACACVRATYLVGAIRILDLLDAHGERRWFPSSQSLAALGSCARSSRGDDYVFANHIGDRMSDHTLRRVFYAAVARAGVAGKRAAGDIHGNSQWRGPLGVLTVLWSLLGGREPASGRGGSVREASEDGRSSDREDR